jgi:hypothetical protein
MKQVIICISIAFVFISCQKHKCTSTNPVFAQYSPNDNEYKQELIRQLKQRDPAAVHYYIEKYIERNKKPWMIVSIESEGLCAKGVIDIKNENKLKEFKNVKGLSYTGAEIVGMQYFIDSANWGYNFIFEEGEIKK